MKVKNHFATLDAMRAIAAIAVTLFHLRNFLPVAPQVAYLAVDLFFALSGFVIASAYEERLINGMSLYSFMRVRIIRLWPLFLLGTLISAAMYVASSLTGNPGSASIYTVAKNGLANIFFIPITVAGAAMFLNPPAWSLMIEVFGNFIYGAIFKHLNKYVLFSVIALGLLGIVYFGFRDGTLDRGANWPELAQGMSRVSFSLFLGIAIFRYRDAWENIIKVHPYVVFIILSASLSAPFHTVLYDLFFVTVISPIMVMAGATQKPIKFSKFLGEMSYVVYILHRPLQIAAVNIAERIHISPAAAGLSITLALLAATPLFSAWYDQPARMILNRVLPRART